jgi:hypothetical protein
MNCTNCVYIAHHPDEERIEREVCGIYKSEGEIIFIENGKIPRPCLKLPKKKSPTEELFARLLKFGDRRAELMAELSVVEKRVDELKAEIDSLTRAILAQLKNLPAEEKKG